ncbi:MAG: YfiM family protein [Bacteroidia bacterium]|nr:YfiM family protein [Bacteroidia bacterium]
MIIRAVIWLGAIVSPDSGRRPFLFWGGVGASYGLVYGAPMASWYTWQSAQGWRLFDDGAEWKQMDKLGHVWTTYHLSGIYREWALVSGYTSQEAFLWGMLLAWSFQTSIEIADGFFPKWGASVWDVAANTAGTALFCLSEAIRKSPWRIGFRFSFWPTAYAQQRPDLLGRGLAQILKDYNGQTYWLCGFHEKLPIGIAIGHGAEGLLGGYGREPTEVIRAREKRRWILSMDPHWETFFQKGRWALRIFVAIKTPFPALVYVSPKVRLAWVYF